MSPPAGGGAGGGLQSFRIMLLVWQFLHHLLLLVQVSGGQVVTWYRTQVSQDALALEKSFPVMSKTAAVGALVASLDKTTHNLLCCPHDSTCSLFGLIVAAGHNDSASGLVQDCWTWHSQGESQSEYHIFPLPSDVYVWYVSFL